MSPSSAFQSVQWVDHFHRLGPAFAQSIRLSPLDEPELVHLNRGLADDLGLDCRDGKELMSAFNGQRALGPTPPLASLYAGHQFGVWVPQLGDGRAALLGQLRDHTGRLQEIQSKGCGPTPYSRNADGRAVLRSSIREYLCSEAMHGLGIPTTRALALLNSRTPVIREQVEHGAILIRVAQSHLRFGHFEVFASRGQSDQVRALADYLLHYHYRELEEQDDCYLALYTAMVERTARLVARWQAAGFCHGVMNTDNMSALGLTLDYGPFGFMESYNPGYICNHSDVHGRYAFDQQPGVAHWNLACLGQAMLELIDIDAAQAVLEQFPQHFETAYATQMDAKLGLPDSHPGSGSIRESWLKLLAEHSVDYSQAFQQLLELARGDKGGDKWLTSAFADHQDWHSWRRHYLDVIAQANNPETLLSRMSRSNPVYILRNAHVQRAIEEAEQENYAEVDRLFTLMQQPFVRQPGAEYYEHPGPAEYRDVAVSCSS